MWGRGRLSPKGAWGATGWIALLLAALLGAYAFWYEPSSLRVVRHKIVLTRPDAKPFNKLRIAVIADLHAGAPYIDAAKIEKIVRLTNQEMPDLILLGGDYVVNGVIGKRPMPIERIAALLKPLSAPLGVYAVIGNHDRWNNARHIADVLQSTGIRVLENQSATLLGGGRAITLVGIGDDDTHAADPQRALAGVPAGQPALCFTHSPDVFPRLPQTCLLTIAAHTHGGQVDLPFLGRLIVPSRYKQRYAAGLIVERNRTLFVNTGIGTSIIPVRFRVPPEITILDVQVHDTRSR